MCRSLTLALSLFLISACGDDGEETNLTPEPSTSSPSAVPNTPEQTEPESEPSREIPDPAVEEPAVEEPPVEEPPSEAEEEEASEEEDPESIEEPLAEDADEEGDAPEAEEPSPEPATVSPPGPATLGESDGLSVRELIVAESIEDRQPVGAGQRFGADLPQLVAFLNVANDTPEPRILMVAFERPDGRTTGQISLNIPPQATRWRTWARSRNVRSEGRWSAVVTTPTGEEVGRVGFDVVAGPQN